MNKYKRGDKVWFVLLFGIGSPNNQVLYGTVSVDYQTGTYLITTFDGDSWHADAENIFDNADDAKRRLIYLTLTDHET